MAESSSTSTSTSTDPSSTTRMAGMMSGLDTEELVKAMAASTLSKIRKRQQAQQTLTWQQEGYQALITKLQDFQSQYLDITSATSLRSRGNLQKMSAVASDTKLAASAGSSALSGTYKVTKASSAKAAVVTSDGAISSGSLVLDTSKMKNGTDYTLKITLDGNTKDVTFKGGADADATGKNLAAAMNTAFGDIKDGRSSFSFAGGKLTFTEGFTDPVDHSFSIGYSEAAGIPNTVSNITSTSSTLGAIDFGTALSGDLFRINVNGKDFEFDRNSSIQSVVTAINNGNVGAKASFNSLSGKFSIEAEKTGAGSEVILSQSSGNLLNSLFNTTAVTSVDSSMSTGKLTYNAYGKVSGTLADGAVADIKDGLAAGKAYTFGVNVDGKAYNISLDDTKFTSGNTYTNDDIIKEIKTQIESQFAGSDADAKALTAELAISLSDAGALEIRSSKKEVILSTGGDLTVENGSATNKTTPIMTGAMNPYGEGGKVLKDIVLTNGTAAEDVKITGTGEGGMITVNDLTKSGYFSLTKDGRLISNLDDYSANSADASTFMTDFFGSATAKLNNANLDNVLNTGSAIYSKGRNASIQVTDPSGASAYYENADNSFVMSGVTFNVSGFDNFTAATDADAMTVEVAKDNTAVKDLVVKFVDSYNTLVKSLNSVMSEARPKKNGAYFDPLTEEQKKEFDSDEIENWEKEAKKGLLYNDDTIMRALDELSNAMISVSGGMTIFDLGISLSDDRSGGNVFKIDETKLDAAIAKHGDRIADFFTNAETGLATKMNTAVENMVSTSSTKPGYFVQKAGVKDSMYVANNEISRQLKDYDELIKSLQEKYDTETARYWKKFTSLETILAQLNSQAGFFDYAE